MTQFKNKPQTSDQNFNYNRFDFNVIFEKSFELYKKIFAQTGLAIFLFSIIQGLASSAIQFLFFGFSAFAGATEIETEQFSTLTLIGASISNSLLAGLTAPMLASVFGMCKYYVENKTQPPISVFDYYQNPIFGKLFAYGFGLNAFNELIILFFNQLSLDFVGIILIIPVNLLLVLTTPILLFNDLDVSKSINLSLKISTKQPFLILLLLIVASLFAMLGFIALCIGILFTIPLIYIVIYTLYEHQFPSNEEKSIIDEIGIE